MSPKPPQMTAARKRHYDAFVAQMTQTLMTFRHPDLVRTLVPIEWRGLARDPVPKKAKLTLRVDADVLRFYRKLGTGYQAEMNGVLRSFMLGRLAEVFGADPEVEITEPDEMGVFQRALEVQASDLLEEVRRGRLDLE